jgi:hypothetical protein
MRVPKLRWIISAVLGCATLFVLAFAQADMNRFRSNIASMKLVEGEAFTSKTWIDDGWYPAGLRHNYLAVYLGDKDGLAQFGSQVKSAVPSGYTVSVSPPTLFKDYNKRGGELSDYCIVVHVTTLRQVGWFDYGQWLTS